MSYLEFICEHHELARHMRKYDEYAGDAMKDVAMLLGDDEYVADVRDAMEDGRYPSAEALEMLKERGESEEIATLIFDWATERVENEEQTREEAMTRMMRREQLRSRILGAFCMVDPLGRGRVYRLK